MCYLNIEGVLGWLKSQKELITLAKTTPTRATTAAIVPNFFTNITSFINHYYHYLECQSYFDVTD